MCCCGNSDCSTPRSLRSTWGVEGRGSEGGAGGGGAGGAGAGENLQDILRILTLWFNHGAEADVEAALQDGFSRVSIDTWLVVIPQAQPPPSPPFPPPSFPPSCPARLQAMQAGAFHWNAL